MSFRMALPAMKMSTAAFCFAGFAGKNCTRRGAVRVIATPIGCRAFSRSARWQLHTKEMDEKLLASLKVNQSRLMEDIHYTCKWGAGQKWGR
jgi:hypothetical protein